jgi:epoxyqueuosine reductase
MSTTMETSRAEITARVKEWALALGFDAVGIAPAGPSEHATAYRRWADAGYAGEMGYLTREDAVAKRADPAVAVPGARTAVVVAKNYFPGEASPVQDAIADPAALSPVPDDPSRAVFARYARNDDYHDVLTPRLIQLQNRINEELLPVRGRAYMDTGPVLERELARRAGIGWLGRNTMMIRPGAGSYFFLGVILLDVELDHDEPFALDHCGTCTRCIGGCPTGALLGRDDTGAPVMDARRCISYLTIEQKGQIPRELRPLIGNRVYGCDICQEVCPHNAPKFVQITDDEAFWPRQGVHGAELIELMGMDQEEFSRRFRKSPVKRAKRRGLLRNVAVALGNWGSPEAVPVLAKALWDAEPLIRGHSAWALGRIGTQAALATLRGREAGEGDAWVREEISLGLTAAEGS